MAQVKIQAWDHLPLSAAEHGYPPPYLGEQFSLTAPLHLSFVQYCKSRRYLFFCIFRTEHIEKVIRDIFKAWSMLIGVHLSRIHCLEDEE